jgi:hypothetical protein
LARCHSLIQEGLGEELHGGWRCVARLPQRAYYRLSRLSVLNVADWCGAWRGRKEETVWRKVSPKSRRHRGLGPRATATVHKALGPQDHGVGPAILLAPRVATSTNIALDHPDLKKCILVAHFGLIRAQGAPVGGLELGQSCGERGGSFWKGCQV